MATTLTPVVSANWDAERSWTLATYETNGGYAGLRAAVAMGPAAIIVAVSDSGLRGRGGAGYLTGHKWGFLPEPDGGPRYLVVNADESEPGTCKDIPLLLADPHRVIEGLAITAFAIGAHTVFIYLRGEVLHAHRRLHKAIEDARIKGYLGRNILGSGYVIDVVVHAGAGAYICGEETAMLDSIEGRRGHPRLKPPFPAVAGLYGRPTVINNVESIASLPSILARGPAWFRSMGTATSPGHGLFSLSGHVKRPGQYEAPLGITLRELLEMAGGMRKGHQLKFWTPGGSSTALLTSEHLDVPLDHDSLAVAGSALGTRGVQVFDDTTCVVRAVARWARFYAHESCGLCTPCREGTSWLSQALARIERGGGTPADLDTLVDVCGNICGRSFCPLGDGATETVVSAIQLFRSEFGAHITDGACPFDPRASALFTVAPHASTAGSSPAGARQADARTGSRTSKGTVRP